MRRVGAARSTPLVPKELILPVCQRLAFVLFAMCSTALGLRLYARWKLGMLGGKPVARLSLDPLNATRFFLDISVHAKGNQMNTGTKDLEDAGWKGVCVKAFPDAERACDKIAMPVAPTDGEQVLVSDCTATKPSFSQVVLSSFSSRFAASCPVVAKPSLGIEALLKLSKAPRVIDYVSLDTEGTEQAILERFPFKDFCVRSWAVNKGSVDENNANIEALFKAQACSLDGGDGYQLARCPCDEAVLAETGSNGGKGSGRKSKTFASKARKHKKSQKTNEVLHVGSQGALMRSIK